ncbi:glycoside hydrolase [Mollisia scopiformis]|uniref:glucan endo-1,3-beta-D-glucosidase n=1 Tax=Mollisia scopiformis TaxID=149040 RepID=A0A132BBW5_MOLSC|nr:glycoside hydrolase [Mollisia scopiformis]KUJ09499.1 glycoside hydrolase [Mollisia scopiformis]
MQHRYSFEDDDQPYDGRRTPEQLNSPSHTPYNPTAHPDSSFNRLRAARRYSRDREPLQGYGETITAPPPPPHRDLGYTNSAYSNITPGADNFGEQAAGGMAGIAMTVADANARESGLEAMRNTPGYDSRVEENIPLEDSFTRPTARHSEMSSTSLTPLGAAAFPPGMATPQSRSTVSRSPHSFEHQPYVDNPPYNEFRYSRNVDPSLTQFDPNTIADDGDDGLEYRQQSRGSMLSLGRHSDHAVPAAGAAATGGVLGALGGLVGRAGSGNAAPTAYDPVMREGEEKSAWLNKQSTGSKKLRWLVICVVGFLILAAIVGGTVGGILASRHSGSSSSSPAGQSAGQDTAANGDLNKNSPEIVALMNNPDLHKVFPGIDYTPMYTQYPDCLSYPPSQNNVTRDLAVLSQLTNTVRLYGTDCNQTEMLLHSIDQLGLNGTVKVWMGVWLDTNTTTNTRQIAQMYDIFKKYGSASFVGVIVGNEVLFRQDMTVTQLGDVITGVKSNLTSMGISLPVASSDLGDNWTAKFADQVDYLMANIHPFFAGVTAEEAAGWTWDFWTGHDTILKTDITKNVISETGWPSIGGMDCGAATTCTNGSIAGITEMNTFMGDWVCDALTNGTNYFWFEAFDEPWKIVYDTPGEEWEDHWGLMDVNRKLKDGVVIPSCGGKTVS